MKDNESQLTLTLQQSINSLSEIVNGKDSDLLVKIGYTEECVQKKDELRRIKKTLEQYLKKSGNLTYIGFVGNFSTGKSSAINNLLGLYNKQLERETGLHPTDTKITLLTHPDNSQNIIGSHVSGELQVGNEYIDIDVLKKFVIIDTPGSGDPSLMKEMIRDFLPICDKLVYVFSASNPLNISDIPVLKKSQKELPFIPIKFLITRSEEFKKERNMDLSNENIDENKKNDFSNQLISRLESIIEENKINKDDIIYIDNVEKYGVDNLKEKILKSENIEKIHLHKIGYFINNAKIIREFYYNHLLKQLSFINDLSDITEKNHTNYKNINIMGNNRLAEGWLEANQQLIKRTENIKKEESDNIKRIEIPGSMSDYSITESYESKFKSQLEIYSENIINEKVDHVIKKYESYFSDELTKIFKYFDVNKIEEIELEKINDDFLCLSNDLKEKEKIKTYHEPDYLRNSLNNLLIPKLSSIIDVLDSAKTSIKNKIDIKSINALVSKEEGKIENILSQFFEQVLVYKAAMTSINGRKLIQNLSLGEMLDSLDQVILPEEEKEYLKLKLINKIQPKYEEKKVRFKENIHKNLTSIDKLHEKSISILQDIDDFSKRDFSLPLGHTIDIDVTDNFEVIHKSIRNNIIRQKESILSAIDSSRKNVIFKLDAKRKDILRKRKNHIFGFMGIGFLFCSLVLLSYLDFKFDSSWGSTITIAVIAQVFTVFLFFFIGKHFDNSDLKLKESEQEINNDEKENLRDGIEKNRLKVYYSDDFSDSKEILLSSIRSDLDGIKNKEKKCVLKEYEEYYEKTKDISALVEKEINSYTENRIMFLQEILNYYKSPDENINEIEKISKEIMDKSITPSLDIFKERKSRLSLLKTKIAKIEFS